MKKLVMMLFVICGLLTLTGCQTTQTADSKIATAQEKHLEEGAAQVPPASIVNWNEKRQVNFILETRDQMALATWTYTKVAGGPEGGKYTFICESVGYGIPYATQSTNPQHYTFVSTPYRNAGGGTSYTDSDGNSVVGEYAMMPQAEPNGLFVPGEARGTWNICRNPNNGKPAVSFQEEEISVFAYRLPDGMVTGYHPQPLDPLSATDMERVLADAKAAHEKSNMASHPSGK